MRESERARDDSSRIKLEREVILAEDGERERERERETETERDRKRGVASSVCRRV